MKLVSFSAVPFTFGSSCQQANSFAVVNVGVILCPPITYYWTGLLILDHSYLVGNLTNSKIAETKALEPIKS